MPMFSVLPGSQSLRARKPAEITGFLIQLILTPIIVQRTRLLVWRGDAEQQCNNIFFFYDKRKGKYRDCLHQMQLSPLNYTSAGKNNEWAPPDKSARRGKNIFRLRGPIIA